MKKVFKRSLSILLCLSVVLSIGGCSWFSNEMKTIKGNLIGNHFNIGFYDNFGSNVLNVSGNKVGLEANYIETKSVDSEGNDTTNYEQTSVITLTVDGHQMVQTGDSVIFAEEGLKKIEDFEMEKDIVSNGGGTLNILDRNINKLKNIIGTSKVIIICSQLGVPIEVYGGEEVYWEIPDDLPKTTKLNIDGKALYVHRANYVILDADML